MDHVIVARLRSEVERAKTAYEESRIVFHRMAADARSGQSPADEKQRVQDASDHQLHAMIAYTNALRQFNQYLLTGAVQEEKRPAAGTSPEIKVTQQGA